MAVVVNNNPDLNSLLTEMKLDENNIVTIEETQDDPEAASSSSELIFTLPDKPVPVDVAATLGEPSFESLGLASWWPAGRIQYLMESVSCLICPFSPYIF